MQLVADIGGTNTRLGLAENGQLLRDTVLSVPNAGFDDFYAVLEQYQTQMHPAEPQAVCVAIAGPVHGGEGTLTNLDWHLEADRLSHASGAGRAVVVNDLAALAFAIPHLSGTQMQPLRPAGPKPRRNGQAAVLGLGTGVNLAASHMAQGIHHVTETEAGHAALPACVHETLARAVGPDQARAFLSVEHLFAGRGLSHLHACRTQDNRSGQDLTASQDAAAQETVALFARLLGQTLREMILLYLPMEGVYLAGSVARGVLSVASAPFLEALTQPHEMADILAAPAVSVILDDSAGLIGCAARLAEKTA